MAVAVVETPRHPVGVVVALSTTQLLALPAGGRLSVAVEDEEGGPVELAVAPPSQPATSPEAGGEDASSSPPRHAAARATSGSDAATRGTAAVVRGRMQAFLQLSKV